MDDIDGVHALSLDVELGDRALTITPTAVETPQGPLLLDVGLPGNVDVLAAALADVGLAVDDVWALVLTHQDLDHAGCLAAVAERTGATVFAHETEAPYLEGDRELVKSSDERPMSIEPTMVDVRLTGGETFATHAGPMTVVPTPGHSPGHVSCHLPDAGLLVSADALTVAAGELVGPRADVTQDMDLAWESVARLADLAFERTLCFHGGFVDAGTARIEELLAAR